MTLRSPWLAGTLCCLIAACSSDTSGPSPSECGPATLALSRTGAPGVEGALVALSPLNAVTVNAQELGACLSLAADSGTYVVIPQFATGSGPVSLSGISYQLSAGNAASSRVLGDIAMGGTATGSRPSPQQRLDVALRTREHRLAGESPASLARFFASRNAVSRAATLPAVGSTRTFDVLNNINGNSFVVDTAVLRLIGTNIMIYMDKNAPAPPQGFTDAQLAAFSNLFDHELYGIDVNLFGPPSDIDGNGHVIVLFTPTVNKLTTADECSTAGYVSGFFYGLDLLPDQRGSNGGEIFYSLAPDSAGTFSCSHSISQVDRTTPATFIHEFQHMISWNQHVIQRNGQDEALWLNEGMSHIAEEMGSRYFEHKYPPPLERTNPAQLFPDSAEGFITGDLSNAYQYLLTPEQFSITQFLQGGTTQERGGVWLFLRWLGDQKDSTIYTKLEQTSLTGVDNMQTQTGESLPQLFGDFSVALYTDSLVGLSRSVIPARWRFQSRNLREMFQALYNATSDDRADFPRPFPTPVQTLAPSGTESASMVPGTEQFYRLQLTRSGSNVELQFTDPGGNAFTNQLLGAQVSVFRCPSAQACQ
ncbi:MAG TPA: hypothetical protein VN677_15210 [Gemmatimonadaceae bacterium]|nr:hypothetical protein [Gemmatimonadaceae bacterium]